MSIQAGDVLTVVAPNMVIRGWVTVKSVNEQDNTIEIEGTMPAGTTAEDQLLMGRYEGLHAPLEALKGLARH